MGQQPVAQDKTVDFVASDSMSLVNRRLWQQGRLRVKHLQHPIWSDAELNAFNYSDRSGWLDQARQGIWHRDIEATWSSGRLIVRFHNSRCSCSPADAGDLSPCAPSERSRRRGVVREFSGLHFMHLDHLFGAEHIVKMWSDASRELYRHRAPGIGTLRWRSCELRARGRASGAGG